MKIYNVAQLAKELGMSERSIRGAVKNGNLTAYKKLRKWYILHSDVVEWIKK